jgi:SAM-dependent methyltransferase
MKFSELVELRERLTTVYDTSAISTGVDVLDTNLCHIKNSVNDLALKDEVSDLTTDLHRIYTTLKLNQDRYTALLNHVNQRISSEAAKFFTDNYELELKYSNVEEIRKRRVMPISSETQDEIINRIRQYTSWKYPALEIGCRDGEWTEYMVAADPLYIVDNYREFTDSAVSKFNETYQRRVRVYLTHESDLSALPRGQMAFVFCWNFLNYASFDTVKEYLKSVKTILRPGGTFLFSYNDGDRPGCAGMAESFFMSYIPRSMLIPLCESLGYQVVHDCAREMTVSWLEIQLPGELKTVKAHQVMGEIKHINN